MTFICQYAKVRLKATHGGLPEKPLKHTMAHFTITVYCKPHLI